MSPFVMACPPTPAANLQHCSLTDAITHGWSCGITRVVVPVPVPVPCAVYMVGPQTSAGGGAAGDGSGASPPDHHVLKFEAVMYKVRDDEYVIDIQVRHTAVKMAQYSTMVYAGRGMLWVKPCTCAPCLLAGYRTCSPRHPHTILCVGCCPCPCVCYACLSNRLTGPFAARHRCLSIPSAADPLFVAPLRSAWTASCSCSWTCAAASCRTCGYEGGGGGGGGCKVVGEDWEAALCSVSDLRSAAMPPSCRARSAHTTLRAAAGAGPQQGGLEYWYAETRSGRARGLEGAGARDMGTVHGAGGHGVRCACSRLWVWAFRVLLAADAYRRGRCTGCKQRGRAIGDGAVGTLVDACTAAACGLVHGSACDADTHTPYMCVWAWQARLEVQQAAYVGDTS